MCLVVKVMLKGGLIVFAYTVDVGRGHSGDKLEKVVSVDETAQ